MSLLKRLANNTHPSGFGTRMRQKRHAFFIDLLSSLPHPITILDLGGTELYWKTMGSLDSQDIQITLLNSGKIKTTRQNITSVVGDATRMDIFEDQSFDVVFSNSVIEHVGDFENQNRMAKEVTRIGKRYFVQTPNYWFPIEPHFLLPGFQWLPVSLRAWLIQHFDLVVSQAETDG